MAADTIDAEAAELLDALVREDPKGKYGGYYGLKLEDSAAGKAMLGVDREVQARLAALTLDRIVELDRQAKAIREGAAYPHNPHLEKGWSAVWEPRQLYEVALRGLLRRKLPLPGALVARILGWVSQADSVGSYAYPLAGIATAVENLAESGAVPEEVRASLADAVAKLREHSRDADCRKAADRLEAVVSTGPTVRIAPGEAWSDAAIADLEAMPGDERSRWVVLIAHCQTASGGKPAAKWLKEARKLVEAVGVESLKGRLVRWLPLVDRPRTQTKERASEWEPDWDNLILPPHVDMLKGLAWCAGLHEDRDVSRALTALALSAYRKIPGKGPRLVTLGNAAVAGLGMMPGREAIGQLALLKVKVKFGTAQKEVEKALDAAAAREGLPRDEVEELGVPAYGLEEVGRRREVFGDYVAELVVDGSDVELRWSKADGKPLKSIPTAVKKDHGEDVKELQAATKDAARMLAAQRERIDNLYLSGKSWPFDVWRERYLDHPLVGTIARRLIWEFATEGQTRAGIWHDGRIADAEDRPLEGLGAGTAVTLWHPIGHPVEDVLAWRRWLEEHGVRQPFKQAHREVYLLTDAERATRVYSNRFAAHVLRQHQFHALCAARGWRNRLRLSVDDTYPPATRELPVWGLRAEYWVEGIGDEYGTDTNDSGVYHRIATDQVRFYRTGAAQRHAHAGGGGYQPGWGGADADPMSLDEVPPLVFSEILRDVDLFVGVASVGNDPTWADGGPDGRFVDYWRGYSFGDLSATAQTRKAVLERLVPRLKIAPRCSFNDKFLVVRGDLRTYKIHLGSGNILMEPNDQYLCIVPKQSAGAGTGQVFLPFEGDNQLSIILSKALLLADDTKIDDPTITRQIRPG